MMSVATIGAITIAAIATTGTTTTGITATEFCATLLHRCGMNTAGIVRTGTRFG
jgi:hypothetical protein